MVNRAVIVGRLVKDNELKATSTGTTVLSNVLAFDDFYENKVRAGYIQVIFFGKLAENVCKYTSKGSTICVDGKLRQKFYQNKKGEKQRIFEIIAFDTTFLSGKGEVNAGEIISDEDILEMEDLPF